MIDWLVLGAGVAIGGLMAGLWARTAGRKREELRAISLETHRQTLEVGAARARTDLLKAEAKEKAAAEELGLTRRTAAALRTELEALRAAFDEADQSRDIATHRIENARTELAASRVRVGELERQLEVLATRAPAIAGWGGGVETDEQSSGSGEGSAVHEDSSQVQLEGELARLEAELDDVRAQRDRLAAEAIDQRARAESARARLAAKVTEQEHRLEEALHLARSSGSDRDAAMRRADGQAVRLGELEAALRAEQVAHQEELAALAAQRGALLAQVERLEPLRRQVADREELIRSLARERDDATAGLLRVEREAVSQGEELAVLRREREQLATANGANHTRVVELETRLAVLARERDQLSAEQKRTNAKIESLRAEIRERDVRFRALLDDRRSFVEASRAQEARLREDLVRARLNGESVGAARPLGDSGDDLKRIYGIGPAIERLLHGRGITTFRQVAELTEADLDEISRSIGGYRGRIARDHWAEQARREHERSHGDRLE